MKKRKSFYNNKKRNQKWTEEDKGRKIDFADKYIEGGDVSDKFDSKRPKQTKNYAKKKAKKQKRLKNLAIAVMCLVLICVGYIAMDVHMTRRESAIDLSSASGSEESGMKDINLQFSSFKTDSISLDSSVMLSSVINDVSSSGFTSITFDAKRSDGTIGYSSALASVDTFSALSSPASKPQSSFKELIANDILPIARISCYKDNIVPNYMPEAAITAKNGKVYKDSESNTYLNPDSETAYNYIKDIITELNSMGVSVFVLCDTDLPEDIAKSYHGGFDALSNKLYNDIGNGIKLLEEKDVTVTGRDKSSGKVTNAAIKEEIDAFEKIDKNKTYYITSKVDTKQLTAQLEKKNIKSYIISNRE